MEFAHLSLAFQGIADNFVVVAAHAVLVVVVFYARVVLVSLVVERLLNAVKAEV